MQVNNLKRVFAIEEYCMSCKLCEIHCLVKHSESKDIIKAFKKEKPRILSRNLVEKKGAVSFSITCRHCPEAPCITTCMTGAMQRESKTKAVIVDGDKCVGCWMCVMVCPFGVIKRDIEHGKVASKCDLCYDEEMPVCVKNCPNEALVYEER